MVEHTRLAVGFEDREEAKKLGARWDPDKKQWYATGPNKEKLLSRWPPEIVMSGHSMDPTFFIPKPTSKRKTQEARKRE